MNEANRHARSSNSRMQTPAPLKGLIFTDTGATMTPTATKNRGKLYRYYVSMDVIKNRTTEDDSGAGQAPTRLSASMVEDAIVTKVRRVLQTPEVFKDALRALVEKVELVPVSSRGRLGRQIRNQRQTWPCDPPSRGTGEPAASGLRTAYA
ncbi:hypothetical protein CDV50_07580 [Haematobacter massiliensis]|uniref:Site-specific recombinase n=1 Tax=Haematobacter massiliensis TaxID=195105 RepID=A0A086Y4L7_9RHOB|nr:hypothetical protein [Haematobacter massiliensis]KFI29217.1 site-specific recombinase [Haematobacter massiliensis]OWJ71937.1 hypothetical protein CDV50_07580 [Haematobacter massiliensis]OWJ82197.1 hypothetical protein CDV51_18440 [Haematobacter massiliensis]QBJ25834.1 hypothetical protein HmaOT1_15925 [Haematobacter massiliensis]